MPRPHNRLIAPIIIAIIIPTFRKGIGISTQTTNIDRDDRTPGVIDVQEGLPPDHRIDERPGRQS